MNGPEPDQVMRKRLGHVLIGAHVLDGLARLPSESVQTCITSPPYYGLRHYNTEPQIWGGEANCKHDWREIPEKKRDRDEPHLKQKQSTNAGSVTPLPETHLCTRCGAWCGELGLEPAPEMYIAHLVTIFREVRRILRPDGTLWLNLGDSYWGGKGQSGQASAEQQAKRKHLSINRPHQQVGGKGVTRPQDGKHPILKPKDMIGIPWRVALALQADGWWLRSDVIWHKPDVMPESVRDRPTKAHEYVFLLAKSKHYYYDADAIREPHQDASFLRQQRAVLQHKYREGAPGQTEHTFLRSRPHAKGRRSAQEALDEGHGLHPLGRNKRTVWTLPTTSYKGAHFATFPTALIEPCIRAGTPIDGWVLDPFFGSGTTGEVASRLGRWFAGIELGSVYIGLAKERLFKAWEAEKRAGSLKELPALFIWNESGGRAKPC